MKIAFHELENWEKEKVSARFPDHELVFVDEPLSVDTAVTDAEVVSVFIYSRLYREQIDKMPNLKCIATRSTGYDHIDKEYAREKGIIVAYVPTYGENTVAEMALALTLTLSRKIFASALRTREHHSFKTDRSLRGFDLKGRTMGLVGCGNIGKHVARMANGFEMKVVVYDVMHNDDLAREFNFSYVSMDELFAQADVISIHVPYIKPTHHLLNDEAFNKMKDGVLIINTSRGPVIDTDALVRALENGKVGGAGLDVLEHESEVKEEETVVLTRPRDPEELRVMLEDHVLMKMDNVIVTPHNAFNSWEALERILNTTMENIEHYTRGEEVKNVVK